MPKQDGILPLRGSIDNITFTKTQDGYKARKRVAIDKQRVMTASGFERTRENMQEFTRAAKGGKLLRQALSTLVKKYKDKRLIARVHGVMLKVVKADAINDRGQRNVIDGEVELLKGFEFNSNSLLSTILNAPLSVSIDRVNGQLKVNIPSFVPTNKLSAPAATTHFRFVSGGVEIDFETAQWKGEFKSSDMTPWNTDATSDIAIVNEVAPNSIHPLFLALGVEFYQEVNGKMYELKSGAFTALSLVDVSGQ